MTVEKKTYSVTLSGDEVATITNALHAFYKKMKDAPQESQEASKKAYEKMQSIRSLRNSFAELINTSYMGADA